MTTLPVRAAFALMFVLLFTAGQADGQFLNKKLQPSKIKREDPKKSNLLKEDGAIYLEEILDEKVEITITLAAPAYTNLTGQRWIGTVKANQKGVLLAVSEKAYRVRARAQQGQIAGWISKAAVKGLNEDFDENVKKYYKRHRLVSELISKNQVALGMTLVEVQQSIGSPNKRSSKIDKNGRKDTLEWITYDRVPQSTYGRNSLGQPSSITTYVKVETGRVTIEFDEDRVASIEESEGSDFAKGGARIVPPPICLF